MIASYYNYNPRTNKVEIEEKYLKFSSKDPDYYYKIIYLTSTIEHEFIHKRQNEERKKKGINSNIPYTASDEIEAYSYEIGYMTKIIQDMLQASNTAEVCSFFKALEKEKLHEAAKDELKKILKVSKGGKFYNYPSLITPKNDAIEKFFDAYSWIKPQEGKFTYNPGGK